MTRICPAGQQPPYAAVIGALRPPVVLPFTSATVDIGFNPPDFRVGCDPSRPTTRLRLVPNRGGSCLFHCNIYGGVGHEDMNGGGESRKFLPHRGSPPARIGQGRHCRSRV